MKKIVLLLSLLASTNIVFSQWTGTNPLGTTSAVGVGTTTPAAKMQVHSNNPMGNTSPALLVSAANGGGSGNIFEAINYANILGTWVPSKDFWITTTGLVAVAKSMRIGATAANGAYANYKLSVDGDMIAKRCVIQVDNWADYVFANDYELPTLNEVKNYITENKHLPGIPSESEIKEKGVEIGEMNKLLMQKVEELTLYIIDLKKEIDEIKAKK